MAKAPNRRPLTAEEKEESRRLAEAFRAFQDKNPGASQEWLGRQSGIGGQSAVSHYLLGNIPMGLEALVRMCGVLGVSPHEISPRLMAQFFGAAGSTMVAANPSEQQVNPNSSGISSGVQPAYTSNDDELRQYITTSVDNEGLSSELLNALAWMIRAADLPSVRRRQRHTRTVKLKDGRSPKRGRTGTE